MKIETVHLSLETTKPLADMITAHSPDISMDSITNTDDEIKLIKAAVESSFPSDLIDIFKSDSPREAIIFTNNLYFKKLLTFYLRLQTGTDMSDEEFGYSNNTTQDLTESIWTHIENCWRYSFDSIDEDDNGDVIDPGRNPEWDESYVPHPKVLNFGATTIDQMYIRVLCAMSDFNHCEFTNEFLIEFWKSQESDLTQTNEDFRATPIVFIFVNKQGELEIMKKSFLSVIYETLPWVM